MFRKPSEAELIELENSLIPPLLEEIEARAGWYPKPDSGIGDTPVLDRTSPVPRPADEGAKPEKGPRETVITAYQVASTLRRSKTKSLDRAGVDQFDSWGVL